MKIRDVMVRDVIAVDPSASLAEAAQLMRQANVGILPVVEDGQVCGVITDRDLVVRALAVDADLVSTPVLALGLVRGPPPRRWLPWLPRARFDRGPDRSRARRSQPARRKIRGCR